MRYLQQVGVMLLLLVPVRPTQGHFGELYGLGISGMASANTSRSRCEASAHGAYLNPALLGCFSDGRLSAGYAFGVDHLNPIEGVVTSSSRYPTNPDSLSSIGAFSTDYPNHQALQLGFHLPLLPSHEWTREHHLQVGASIHWNLKHPISLHTGPAFAPTYIEYDRRDQRFFVAASAGLSLWPDRLWLGTGFQVYHTAGATGVILYDTENPAGQLAMDFDLHIAAIAGVRFRPLRQVPVFASFVYHQGMRPKLKMKTRSDIIINNTSVPFIFDAQTTLYGEPDRFRFSLAWDSPQLGFELGLQYELWKRVSLSRLTIDFEVPGNDSLDETRRYVNRFSFHQGARFRVAGFEILQGLSYRPSLIGSLAGAPENQIDPDTWIIAFGIKHTLPWWTNLMIGVAYQLHLLNRSTITKDSNTMLGFPNYHVGGQAHLVSVGIETAL